MTAFAKQSESRPGFEAFSQEGRTAGFRSLLYIERPFKRPGISRAFFASVPRRS